MKKLLLFTLSVITSALSFGQIINGNFEAWSNFSWENLTQGRTSAGEIVRYGLPSNTTKTTDKQSGTYAIKLETVQAGSDTMFGYFIFGDIKDEPIRGIPFTQKPTSMNGYYKSALLTGDTAIMLAIFWDDDTVCSMNIGTFTGTQSTYAHFSFPLTIPGANSVDSITFAAASGNPFNGITPLPGSWIQFDSIYFGGTAITQNIPNNGFENWTTINVESPDDWYNWNAPLKAVADTVYVKKVAPAYKGNYALELTTFWIDSNMINIVTNAAGQTDTGSFYGGAAFSNQTDTLIGWYKYTPNGADTASVNIAFYKNDTLFDWQGVWLQAAASYTQFSIPFTVSKTPDTIQIFIASSSWNMGVSGAGSKLIIDEIQFKSAPLNTGVPAISKTIFGSRFYPNPAKDFAKVEYELTENSNMTFVVYDITGREVFAKEYANQSIGNNIILLNTSSFKSGLYIYTIGSEKGTVSTGKFTKE